MKDKFFEKLLIFSWIFMLFFCLALLSFTSHAAGEQDYFPMEQNKNNHFGQNEISTISSTFNDDDYYIFVMYNDYNYYLIRYPKADKVNGMICGEKSNNLQTFSLYQVGSLTSVQAYKFQFLYGNIVNQQTLSPPFNYFQNFPSSNYNSNVDYISNYIIFTNNTAAKKIVLLYDIEPEYDDEGNDTYPNNFDQPDIGNYYDPGSAPSFDGSTVENAVESLYNLWKWYISDDKGLPGLFKYLKDSINWAIQKVINNIRNKLEEVAIELQEAIEDFSETVSGYLDDIKDYFDYVTEPVDSDVIYDNISGTSLVGNITTIQSSLTSFQTSFNSVSEPNEYKIAIHLENLPQSYFGIQTVQYIDLGVINGDVKAALRMFVWAMVTYGLVITIFDSISNYINGGGDES